MKRFLYIVGTFIFCMASLVACSFTLSSKIKNNMSELSKVLYSGDCQTFFATLTSGTREEPYLYNGISENKIDFAILNLTFYSNMSEETIPVEIIIDEEHFERTLEKNPYTSNYMVDLEMFVDASATISIMVNNEEISLLCTSENFVVNYEHAITIALENLNDELTTRFKDTSFDAECYLKILNNPTQNKNVFFWYFSVRDKSGTVVTIVIDTMSNTVLAKYWKNNNKKNN